jgi:hypothetical protein
MYRNSSDWKRKGLERQWSSFSDAIKRFSEQVRAMSYDGITVYENDRPCGGIDTTDRYLLPRQSKWLSFDELFETPPIPDFPDIPEPPPLHLTKGEYDSWYLEPGRGGTLSYFDRDLKERNSTLAMRDALRELIAEKKRNFTGTQDAVAFRLGGLRAKHSNEEPKAVKELIEIANMRQLVSYRVQKDFRTFVDPNAKVVLIELQFPDFTKHQFQIGKTARGNSKYASDALKKKIVNKPIKLVYSGRGESFVLHSAHLGCDFPAISALPSGICASSFASEVRCW